MAVYRQTPKCPKCGKIIARGIYADQSDTPMVMRKIGDSFIRWEYLPHKCKKENK